MTARVWTVGDPEPADHPPLVDNDGVTWLWFEDDEDGDVYVQQQATDHGRGVVTGWQASSWEFLPDEHGPLREATPAEAGFFRLTYEREADSDRR